MLKTDEYSAIKETISYYLDGVEKLDFDYLCKGWNESCQMMGKDKDGNLVTYQRNFWIDAFSKSQNSQVTRNAFIASIDYFQDVGNVKVITKVTTENDQYAFVDYLNLIIIQGKWQIMNKVYTVDR
jgi:hypothetical protein